MTIVLDLAQARAKKQKMAPESLNEFLKRATKLIGKISARQDSGVITAARSIDELKRRMEGVIAKKIIKAKMIDKGLFLCGIYVPQIFTEYLSSSPESWLAVDYALWAIKRKNAFVFKKGGDVCFLICSIFPERANWRTISKKEIGYHMSSNFETMVGITKECVPLI
ncbi:hypothetical protein L6274_02655 [Candidatus Parcubacteria bacterium]|nr:hypothetical protein [Candidatus Parcubacteria bacterium]MCG2809120.1 hypothetical protein [Candidatus Portnoybacteria bacterium]